MNVAIILRDFLFVVFFASKIKLFNKISIGIYNPNPNP